MIVDQRLGKMASVNVDLSSVIAAQFLEQLSEEERNSLIQEVSKN